MRDKPFRLIHFQEKWSVNPLESHTFKTKDLKSFRITHFQKRGRGWGREAVQDSSHQVSGAGPPFFEFRISRFEFRVVLCESRFIGTGFSSRSTRRGSGTSPEFERLTSWRLALSNAFLLMRKPITMPQGDRSQCPASARHALRLPANGQFPSRGIREALESPRGVTGETFRPFAPYTQETGCVRGCVCKSGGMTSRLGN